MLGSRRVIRLKYLNKPDSATSVRPPTALHSLVTMPLGGNEGSPPPRRVKRIYAYMHKTRIPVD